MIIRLRTPAARDRARFAACAPPAVKQRPPSARRRRAGRPGKLHETGTGMFRFPGSGRRARLKLVAVTEQSDAETRSARRAAMLLIVTGGALLMHHRDDKPGIAHPGCWAGFGGAVEAGETVEEALVREVREETGLVIEDPVFLTNAVDHEGDGRLVSLCYVAGDFRPADIDLHEGAGVGIQRIADLPGLKVTPFVRRAIESHLLPALAARR
jgi:8-oxo-dGTP pyrophosphatase MutT (NUDIX family)